MNALPQGFVVAGVWAACAVVAYIMWRLAAARPQAPTRILVRLDPSRHKRIPRR